MFRACTQRDSPIMPYTTLLGGHAIQHGRYQCIRTWEALHWGVESEQAAMEQGARFGNAA